MGRTKLIINQLNLSNTQSPISTIPIDTNASGVAFGVATVSNKFYIKNYTSGIELDGTTSGIIFRATNSGSGLVAYIPNSAGFSITDSGITSGGFNVNLTGSSPIHLTSQTQKIYITPSGILLQNELTSASTGITLNNVYDGTIFIFNTATTNGGIQSQNTNDGLIYIHNTASTNGGIQIINANNGDIVIDNSFGDIIVGSENILYGSTQLRSSHQSGTPNFYIGDFWSKNANNNQNHITIRTEVGVGVNGILLDTQVGIIKLQCNDSTNGGIQILNFGNNDLILESSMSTTAIYLNGAQKQKVSSIDNTSSPYLASHDYIILGNATVGAIIINLPSVGVSNKKVYNIKNTGSVNNITVVPNGAEKIETLSSFVLLVGEEIEIVCDGVAWWII